VAPGDAHQEMLVEWHSSQPMVERQRCPRTEYSGPRRFYAWSSIIRGQTGLTLCETRKPPAHNLVLSRAHFGLVIAIEKMSALENFLPPL
jgi:hypothetical protein